MKKYITYLINDMREAAENLPVKTNCIIPAEDESLEYLIELENTTAKPMQEWMGIPKEKFPPLEKLTGEQLTLLVYEILKLWKAYNFEAELPDSLPSDIKYKVLRDYFDKPVEWMSKGTVHIEFCDYDPDNCPFPEKFCWCKKLRDEENNSQY